MPRPGRRSPSARAAAKACLVIALAPAVAGCGGSGATSPTAPPSKRATARATSSATATTSASAKRRAKRHAKRHAKHRARPRGAPIGAVQRVHAGSSILSVTVTRVLDALSPSDAALLPRMSGVGVMVTIRNDSGGTYDSTASGDWSLLTAAGLATPLSVRGGPCQTQLVDFESLIGVGETRAGCVAFSVPRGARIVQIRFSPHSRAPGRVAWR